MQPNRGVGTDTFKLATWGGVGLHPVLNQTPHLTCTWGCVCFPVINVKRASIVVDFMKAIKDHIRRVVYSMVVCVCFCIHTPLLKATPKLCVFVCLCVFWLKSRIMSNLHSTMGYVNCPFYPLTWTQMRRQDTHLLYSKAIFFKI